MNEILKYEGLRGDDDDGKNRIDWNHMTDSVLDALKAFFGKDGQNSNTNNGQNPFNVTVQQDKTLMYIGLGCLALMGIFVLTNSGKK